MGIESTSTTKNLVVDLFRRGEGHFLELKSKASSPARLTKALSAFANADGGELFVGLEDGNEPHLDRWSGFENVEAANGFLQAFEAFFPLGGYFQYGFLSCEGLPGLVLHCEILKTPDVRSASDGKIYVRRGAQSLPYVTDE